MSSSTLKQHSELLLRLPRELRDCIYPHIITESLPIHLDSFIAHEITHPTQSNATVAAEALEAFYVHNTFLVHINQSHSVRVDQPWGPDYVIAQSYIRSLIALTIEASLDPMKSAEEFEEHEWNSSARQNWATLLSMPKLSNLTVRLQKVHDTSFTWWDFGPVLYELRKRNPPVSIAFEISFDNLLEKVWNEPQWHGYNADTDEGEKYQHMGYMAATDFFAPPTEEDKEYVNEYLPDKVMPKGRSIRAGLLYDSPVGRLVLGKWYIVREPALLRVLMEEQFEIYTAKKEERRAEA